MKTVIFTLTIFPLCLFFMGVHAFNPVLEPMKTDAQNDSMAITRIIDASKSFRDFPDLVAYRNTSIQKAPPPVLGKLSEESFGRPKITRCWLNLDELWDYRTRQFNYDFKIGVDKYKDIPEKHRETWDSEIETNISYYEYLQAFSGQSDAIMLTIRRYERDIMDGELPITMADWKMVFKAGLKHYKSRYPNIRYVEVGNEYALKQFMRATAEEYYQFFKLGYEAVNEINEELKLSDDDRILVGGPVVAGSMKRLNRFLELFSSDQSKEKKLDFVSWHEYEQPYYKTAFRGKEVQNMLSKNDLSENLPLFVSEHDPYHFKDDKPEYQHLNAAGLVKSLYFSNLFSPNMILIPWVQYHDSKIQTRFIWFDGPNEPDTKAKELKMMPIGCSMKFLSMHKGREILVDNSLAKDEILLASFEKGRLVVQAVNYGNPRDVNLSINNLKQLFPELNGNKLQIIKYLIDSSHSNCLTNPEYPGGIEKVEEFDLIVSNDGINLSHLKLEKNGILLWEVIQKKQ